MNFIIKNDLSKIRQLILLTLYKYVDDAYKILQK